MHSAVAVDLIICAAPRGSFFSLPPMPCVHYRVYTLRDAERMHTITKVIDHMATWAAPKWESHPELHPPQFSLGEMPWLLSDFVLELRALSSCWDCLCNDDKGLQVIRVGLCRQSFNLSVMNVVQLCQNILSVCDKCCSPHFLFIEP